MRLIAHTFLLLAVLLEQGVSNLDLSLRTGHMYIEIIDGNDGNDEHGDNGAEPDHECNYCASNEISPVCLFVPAVTQSDVFVRFSELDFHFEDHLLPLTATESPPPDLTAHRNFISLC